MVDSSTMPLGYQATPLDSEGTRHLNLEEQNDQACRTDPDDSSSNLPTPNSSLVEPPSLFQPLESDSHPRHDLHRQFQEAEFAHFLLPSSAERDKLESTISEAEAYLDILKADLAKNRIEMEEVRQPLVHHTARLAAIRADVARLEAADRQLVEYHRTFLERYARAQVVIWRNQLQIDDEGLKNFFHFELCHGLFDGLNFSMDQDYEKDFDVYYRGLLVGSDEYTTANLYKVRMERRDERASSQGVQANRRNATYQPEVTLQLNARRRHVDCFIALGLFKTSLDIPIYAEDARVLVRELRWTVGRIMNRREEIKREIDEYDEMRNRALDVLPKVEDDLKESVLQMVVLAKIV